MKTNDVNIMIIAWGLEGEAIKAKPDLSRAWITRVKVRDCSSLAFLFIK
jgi:hypothetical protein